MYERHQLSGHCAQPPRCIRLTMSLGEKRISASLATVEFLPAKTGTDLIFTHQGAFFEGADGPEMRLAGWRKLLDRLRENV